MYNSQFQQDKIVHQNFFIDKNDGYFVDLGAYDGLTQGSNSLFFENLGWKGVCVEPNPILYEKLRKNRSCECFNVAVDDHVGEMDFLLIEGENAPDTLGRLVNDNISEINQLSNSLSADQSSKIIKVKTERFENLVNTVKIDYLSIDTEGNEMKILNTIDFERYDISVLSLENNYKDSRYNHFFRNKPYTRFAFTGCDEIWVKNTLLIN